MTSSNKFSQNIATLHCHVARMALLLCGPVQSSWKRRRGGRESSVSCRENAVGRASDGTWAPVQDVCVDHGGADVLVAEEFLNCPDVMAVLHRWVVGPISRTASTAGRGARYKKVMDSAGECPCRAALSWTIRRSDRADQRSRHAPDPIRPEPTSFDTSGNA
jgi:hypothetical protein